MFIYAFYNYTFNYNESLILRISPLLIIGLSEVSYESSILFHWMQWPLNLISRPVDVCFALQCSSSFINWRSKTLRILITPWYALLQFPCVRFPFVRTYWQILTLEHPQFLSWCSGQRVFVQTLKDGLWGQKVKTPHPGCWRCLYTTPLFIPVAAAVVCHCYCNSAPLIRARSQTRRIPGYPEDTRVCAWPSGQLLGARLLVYLCCWYAYFHRPLGLAYKMLVWRWNYQSFHDGNRKASTTHSKWETTQDMIPFIRNQVTDAGRQPFSHCGATFQQQCGGAAGRHRLPRVVPPTSPCALIGSKQIL